MRTDLLGRPVRRRKRSCVNGHALTPDNVRVVQRRVWVKAIGDWKTYSARRCKRCTKTISRLRARRRRAQGKLASYPQWVAAKQQRDQEVRQ